MQDSMQETWPGTRQQYTNKITKEQGKEVCKKICQVLGKGL